MLNMVDMVLILQDLKYDKPNWSIIVNDTTGVDSSMYLQVQFMEVDIERPDDGPVLQKCRKWRLSPHMTRSEVVATAWQAIQRAELHEAAERFTYKGARIYNPHVDVDALAEFFATERVDVRV